MKTRTLEKHPELRQRSVRSDRVPRPLCAVCEEPLIGPPSQQGRYGMHQECLWRSGSGGGGGGAPRRWTEDMMIQAIRSWAKRHDGEPPTKQEARASNGLPSHSTLALHFGSFNRAIDSAGIAPRPQGERRSSMKLTDRSLRGRRKSNRVMVTGGSWGVKRASGI